MAAPRKKFLVKEGNAQVWVRPWMGKWRFPWRETPLSKEQWTVKPTKAEAEAAAEERLREMTSDGDIVWSGLPTRRRHFLSAVHRECREEDEAALLQFLADRQKSGLVPDAVARFMAFKIASTKGVETKHLAAMRCDLEAFATAFSTSMLIDVPIDPLTRWWDERTGDAGDHRRKAIRTSLVTFWKWAADDGIAGNDKKTTAQRLPTIDPGGGSLFIFQPDELVHLLSIVERKWVPLIILGAFQGIRPEEIAPQQGTKNKRNDTRGKKKAKPKPGLRWEHIRWEFNTIEMPKEITKGKGEKKRSRIMPLHPVTRAWLEAFGALPEWTGPVCLENPTEVFPRATTVWGRALAERFPGRFTGWPQDALRHSYASYRNAGIRNLYQVAEEMGTSEPMLHNHYHNPCSSERGAQWFALTPDAVEICPAWLKISTSGVPVSYQKNEGPHVVSASKAAG